MIHARNMLELKAKVYKAEGWTRKAGESATARVVAAYAVTVNRKANRLEARKREERRP